MILRTHKKGPHLSSKSEHAQSATAHSTENFDVDHGYVKDQGGDGRAKFATLRSPTCTHMY